LRGLRREKIWDPVTRLWHWVLVVAVVLGWSFGEFMSFSTIQYHFYCGYTVLGLILFRCVWGLFGPEPVRVRALLPNPRALLAYVKRLGARVPSGTPGHNPLGALAVIAMIALLGLQASSGLFIESEDYFEAAPLAHLVSDAVTNQLIWWHKLVAKLILGVVVLHVGAIFFYLLWKKENLIIAMITGWKWVKSDAESDG
jgi:cytochrome b